MSLYFYPRADCALSSEGGWVSQVTWWLETDTMLKELHWSLSLPGFRMGSMCSILPTISFCLILTHTKTSHQTLLMWSLLCLRVTFNLLRIINLTRKSKYHPFQVSFLFTTRLPSSSSRFNHACCPLHDYSREIGTAITPQRIRYYTNIEYWYHLRLSQSSL